MVMAGLGAGSFFNQLFGDNAPKWDEANNKMVEFGKSTDRTQVSVWRLVIPIVGINAALDLLSDSLNSTTEGGYAVSSSLWGVNTAILDLQDAIGKAVAPLIDALAPALETVVDALAKMITGFGESKEGQAIMAGIGSAAQGLADAFAYLLENGPKALRLLNEEAKPLRVALKDAADASGEFIKAWATWEPPGLREWQEETGGIFGLKPSDLGLRGPKQPGEPDVPFLPIDPGRAFSPSHQLGGQVTPWTDAHIKAAIHEVSPQYYPLYGPGGPLDPYNPASPTYQEPFHADPSREPQGWLEKTLRWELPGINTFPETNPNFERVNEERIQSYRNKTWVGPGTTDPFAELNNNFTPVTFQPETIPGLTPAPEITINVHGAVIGDDGKDFIHRVVQDALNTSTLRVPGRGGD